MKAECIDRDSRNDKWSGVAMDNKSVNAETKENVSGFKLRQEGEGLG